MTKGENNHRKKTPSSSSDDGDDYDEGDADNDPAIDEQELNNMLMNLDIERDFNMWTSFRSSLSVCTERLPPAAATAKSSSNGNASFSSSASSSTARLAEAAVVAITTAFCAPASVSLSSIPESDEFSAAVTSDDQMQPSASERSLDQSFGDNCAGSSADAAALADWERDDIASWQERLMRSEVYSRRYRPSVDESKELSELESFLGMGGGAVTLRKFMRVFHPVSGEKGGNHNNNNNNAAASSASVTDDQRGVWKRLVHPEKQQPASILLKRGPVLWWKEEQGRDSNGEKNEPEQISKTECELILLTHGFVVARTVPPMRKNIRVVPRVFERAVLWEHVEWLSQAPGMKTGLFLQMKPEALAAVGCQNLKFQCATKNQTGAWLQALEKVFIESHVHVGGSQPRTTEPGWQYRYVIKPAFTLAVTGRMPPLRLPLPGSSKALDLIDTYSGYAALHYAVRANHLQAVRKLLDAGANSNLEDSDGYTPMYHAVHDRLPSQMQELLSQYGARPDSRADSELSGELFGRIEATEKAVQENRQRQQQVEAEKTTAAMNQNMKLLQQRGEKIDELGNRATQLNENAKDFGDMAKQLKERSKQKRWFQL